MRKPGIPNGSKTLQLFAFIEPRLKSTGRLPTAEEIRQHMGWKTTSGVRDAISRLVIRGRLKRTRVGNRYHYELT